MLMTGERVQKPGRKKTRAALHVYTTVTSKTSPEWLKGGEPSGVARRARVQKPKIQSQ